MTEDSYRKRVGAQPLMDAGIRPQAALRLARAGFTSVEKIATATREDLLAVYGVNLLTIEDCEKIIGHELPWPTAFWRSKGLSPRMARLLHRAGIATLEDLGKRSFKDLRALGVGVASIRKCEKLLGRFFEGG
jgi:Helix-hairpin-helix domain